ncbi:PAS domain-containing protein [Candidatus Fermentibacteria bacterium]|nr:PAS domain-containing protein [Candidatus Fermentibacteria bacterium]
MRRRRLFWQLFAAYSLIVGLVLLVVYTVTATTVRKTQVELFSTQIQARAALAREYVRALPDSLIDRACKTLGGSSGTRITVVDPRGTVVGDSDADPSSMENHSDRPEIVGALRGEPSVSVRASGTLRRSMIYATLPIEDSQGVRAVVRAALPFEVVEQSVRDLNGRFAAIAVATAVLLGLLSLGVASRIKAPLARLAESAKAFAQGELRHRVPFTGLTEIDELARSLGDVADQLGERIAIITQERNEREAVLTSMTEGVLSVDSSERVVWMNEACGRIVGVPPERAVGRTIQEAIRNSDLHALVRRALTSVEPVEADLTMLGNSDRYLQAHGAVLRDPQGMRVGAVVVLNDVTRLRRLEQIRRDFVSNVSHELKTPIAAIQGAAETLIEGAMATPCDAATFLDIITRQASRLDAVIRDLLMLSRIEEDEDRAIALTEAPLEAVIGGAVQTCASKAADKRVSVEVACPASIRARINGPLLETAVVNLLDNAITYSEVGGAVVLKVDRNHEVVITVEDHGCGIEPRHLSRIFERFYRVDKARSRTLGGTGLGLAIVKHIIHAHAGSVTVESTPGVGSTFQIHLPLP